MMCQFLGHPTPKSGPGPKGEAPLGGLGDEVSQKLKQFADIVYRS